MDLIIKPTERCNFNCTFCSSTKITEHDSAATLDLNLIFRFLQRFPATRTIIVNGGDPLMMPPSYYQELLDYLDEHDLPATLSLTTNLWPFYKAPAKWTGIFRNPRVGVGTSFQYGGGRLKGDFTEFSESDFWKCSDLMLELVGYRPDFISVITNENRKDALRNVELAKEMGVVCKLNYAVSSGAQVTPFLKADAYELYLDVWRQGLTEWEWNTQQLVRRLREETTSCPLHSDCDREIRALQPEGDYYSCGAFGDDRVYSIDFEAEMAGGFERPLRFQPELQSMKSACYTCPMFSICNGCKKTISDYRRLGLTEAHCKKMKTLAPEIIEANGLTGRLELTPYVNETPDQPQRKPVILLQLQV